MLNSTQQIPQTLATPPQARALPPRARGVPAPIGLPASCRERGRERRGSSSLRSGNTTVGGPDRWLERAARDDFISIDVDFWRIVRCLWFAHGRRRWRRSEKHLGRIELSIPWRICICDGARWDFEGKDPIAVQRDRAGQTAASFLGHRSHDYGHWHGGNHERGVGHVFQRSLSGDWSRDTTSRSLNVGSPRDTRRSTERF
jgi:hypothetical protein